MGQPTEEDNLNGYEDSSVLPRAGNFTDGELLLIHGTGDGTYVLLSVCLLFNLSLCLFISLLSVCLTLYVPSISVIAEIRDIFKFKNANVVTLL